MDYEIDDALEVLENVKNNPYRIKDSHHSIIRVRDRSFNLELIYKKLTQEKPVGIEKDANSSTRFLLIYKFTQFWDLAIAIDILDEDEIIILTVIDKSIERRKH